MCNYTLLGNDMSMNYFENHRYILSRGVLKVLIYVITSLVLNVSELGSSYLYPVLSTEVGTMRREIASDIRNADTESVT